MDSGLRYVKHVLKTTEKAAVSAAALARLMPIIGWPREEKKTTEQHHPRTDTVLGGYMGRCGGKSESEAEISFRTARQCSASNIRISYRLGRCNSRFIKYSTDRFANPQKTKMLQAT